MKTSKDYTYARERRAVVTIAAVVQAMRKGKATHRDLLEAAMDAATLIPIRCCVECGAEYLQSDKRRAKFCTPRCGWRAAQRARRRNAKESAE